MDYGNLAFTVGRHVYQNKDRYIAGFRTARDYYNEYKKRKKPESKAIDMPSSKRARSSNGGRSYKRHKASRIRHVYFRKPSRKRKYKRRRSRRTRGLKRVRKAVHNLQLRTKNTIGKEIVRTSAYVAVTANTGETKYDDIATFSTGSLETHCASTRIYDEDSGGLQTIDLGANTWQGSLLFKEIRSTVTLRNNYQAPCHITLYCCVPKEDTNITPHTAFNNGLTDLGGVGTGLNDHSDLVFPTDSSQFNKLWKIQGCYKETLYPGQEMTKSYLKKNVVYDFSIVDSHASAYQRKYGSHVWFMRMVGTVCHDSVNGPSNVSTGKCGVDIRYATKCKYEYDAGTSVDTIVASEGNAAIANDPITGLHFDPANVSYNVGAS